VVPTIIANAVFLPRHLLPTLASEAADAQTARPSGLKATE